MLKPRFFILAAGVVLALSACIAAPETEVAAMDSGGTQIPEWLDLDGTGQPVRDLTFIGETDVLVAFSSHDDVSDWCILVALKPNEKELGVTAGSSCVSPAKFAREGVGVLIGNETTSGSARIFPDGYSGTIEDGWVRLNDNLAVRE